jgi:hypothetical protein
MRSRVAEQVAIELEAAVAALPPGKRLQLALENGVRDLRAHSVANGVSLDESRRQFELERQRGRTFSRCHLALIE